MRTGTCPADCTGFLGAPTRRSQGPNNSVPRSTRPDENVGTEPRREYRRPHRPDVRQEPVEDGPRLARDAGWRTRAYIVRFPRRLSFALLRPALRARVSVMCSAPLLAPGC